MSTTALYRWNVAGGPVIVLIDLAVVDRFRVASTSSEAEIGGLMIGHFDGEFTVITDFEALESEHKRGSGYTLSTRDELRLRGRLEHLRKRGSSVVGFFRSHLRAGMYLDERDFHIVSSYFSGPNQVVLLVKPSPDRTAVGGFFFWEDGEINRKQTYLTFPMSSRDLELGDFPLMEPSVPSAINTIAAAPEIEDVPEESVAYSAAAYDAPYDPNAAETIDNVRVMPEAPVGEQPFEEMPAAPRPTRVSNVPVSTSKPSVALNQRWGLIGVIAACAAFGGYLIGTAGNHKDQFGSRAGDLTLNPNPEPAPQPAPVVATAARPSAFPAAGTAPAGTLQSSLAPPPVPTDEKLTADQKANRAAAAGSVAQIGKTEIVGKASRTKPTPANAVTATVTNPGANAGWQHFGDAQQPAPVTTPAPAPIETPAPQVAAARPAPAPAPRPTGPTAQSSVSLEAVESGGMSRAFHKIPLFHHSHSGDDFTPPQAVKSFAPRVPQDLARELTGDMPVDLKLTVDKSGHVSSVAILSKQTAREWVRLAGDAAYDWQFEPARVKDKPVASDVIAHFRFSPVL